MGNPIIERCEQLHADGLSVSAVQAESVGGMVKVRININTFLPLGEGGDLPRHTVTVDRRNLPPGVWVRGQDRHEDELMEITGNNEQAEALIREVALTGQAQDVACFDGCRWLTKPNRWFRRSR